MRPSLSVICRPFRPVAGDPLTKKWIRNGERCELSLPAFAIPKVHFAKTRRETDRFLDENHSTLLHELGQNQDELVRIVVAEAARQSHQVSRLVLSLKPHAYV